MEVKEDWWKWVGILDTSNHITVFHNISTVCSAEPYIGTKKSAGYISLQFSVPSPLHSRTTQINYLVQKTSDASQQ